MWKEQARSLGARQTGDGSDRPTTPCHRGPCRLGCDERALDGILRRQGMLEPPGIARVVQLAEAVGAGYAEVKTVAGVAASDEGRSSTLPHTRPRADYGQLYGQEHGAGQEHSDHTDTQSFTDLTLQIHRGHVVPVTP